MARGTDNREPQTADAGKGPSPFMKQFFRAKEQYPDAIVLFRMGDFYELFYDDAVVGAAALDLTLTKRGTGADGVPIPMAGVPHHAVSGYLTRLLEQGHKVAICEQMADPSTVKGIVPREVVRVITPGLCLEEDALDARTENLLVALTTEGERYGLVALELTTASLRATELTGDASLSAELSRLEPREILLAGETSRVEPLLRALLPRTVLRRDARDAEGFAGLLEALSDDVRAASSELSELVSRAMLHALAYAKESQPGRALVLERLAVYDPSDALALDEAAVRSLELIRTQRGETKGSLLHAIDQTATSMGARLLRRQLLSPLTDLGEIRRRHDVVEALIEAPELRAQLRAALARIPDLERLATRASLGAATPRDLGGMRDALAGVAALVASLSAHRSIADDPIARVTPSDVCEDVHGWLAKALVERPPIPDKQGGIFLDGFDAELDDQRALASKGRDYVLELEQRERTRTGISSLKIRYTRVFGYYIEITRSNLGSVPKDYKRKQTVANGERFVTDELGTLEDRILHAEERSLALECARFTALRDDVAREAHRLRRLAGSIAVLDVLASHAEVAHRHGYVRPELDRGSVLDLRDARHPVVERLAASGEFVPNDVCLDAEGKRLMLITGPNMAGKSTAMRQTALAVVLAQMGAFVPAASARIGVVDKIFSRVGASDNLASGQSTFMVEMQETAAILHGATSRSLVIVDEIGRGTSTYDGLAIAWAVAEHLHDATQCRVMFATHYHELCELPQTRAGAFNVNVAAREVGERVVFLRKLVPGGANRSYGVSVARLAGLPPIVLARAQAMLRDLESGSALPSGAPAGLRPVGKDGRAQLDLFAAHAAPAKSEVLAILRELDVNRMTPVDALVALARLHAMLDT